MRTRRTAHFIRVDDTAPEHARRDLDKQMRLLIDQGHRYQSLRIHPRPTLPTVPYWTDPRPPRYTHPRMPKTATATKSTRRVIPLDNEPLTAADLKAIREADEAFARGDYCTLDDLKADLKADVARLRSHKTPKRSPAKVSR